MGVSDIDDDDEARNLLCAQDIYLSLLFRYFSLWEIFYCTRIVYGEFSNEHR